MSSPSPLVERRRPLGRGWRLRHKLAAMLVVAALLPVVGASTVAMRLVLAGLKSGVHAQTERTIRVALNLVLSSVRDVFEESVRLSEVAGLSDLLLLDPQSVSELLERKESQLMPGLVEIADETGKIVGRHRVGGMPRGLALSSSARAVAAALSYERRVTLARGSAPGEPLVVRASAPVVDGAYQLRGAVVVTVPLDAEFAERLKARLSADVVIYRGDAPSASSFVALDGRHQPGFAAPPAVAEAVLAGATQVVELSADGRPFSVGFAPLQDADRRRLGMLAVAVDEEALVAARHSAWRSLALGGASAVLFALALAALMSRRLTRPLGHLHAGALAVARGNLDQQLVPETGDELGELALAFAQMTRAVKENQERLAARMREIVTLQEIGRAVTSVLGLDELLPKIVGEVAQVLGAERCALLLTRAEGGLTLGAGVRLEGAELLPALGELLLRRGGPVRIEEVRQTEGLSEVAEKARVTGPLLAVPLEQKDRTLGLLVVTRRRERPFTRGDLRLVAAFADQVATAISNARLYDEVQKSSEELERKVKERTADLELANRELLRALAELGAAQSALVHSERMAGLGQLVAGVAHEVNSPAAAIQGAVDNLAENVQRLARCARELSDVRLPVEGRVRFFALVEQLAPRLGGARLEAPAQVRRRARELAARLGELGVLQADKACRTLVEIGAAEAAYSLAQLAQTAPGAVDATGVVESLEALVRYLEQYAYLFRNTHAIRTAIRRITRIVGALKGYSHLDQAKTSVADLHEGIENTLVILYTELKYGISLTRDYAELPAVPVYVDELNQVWTNLIHNAVQALGGRGSLVIESRREGEWVAVTIQDDGPGIAEAVMPRIFEPFFTTKAKGEGSGLGLGIVKQIVEKHGGQIEVTSRPGCTRFTVRLPIGGPPHIELGVRPAEENG